MTRARDLGIAIGRIPTGEWNAITDVPGVRVGHVSVIEGDDVRTGVTALHPHEGSVFQAQVPAAIAVLNGAGEITGRSQVEEYGLLETPLLLTSTHEVGNVHRAAVDWIAAQERMASRSLSRDFVLPVVAETWDGFLSDAAGCHIRPEHVHRALDSASSGPVPEGNVGGGTGMGLFQFKGGTGTSSRVVTIEGRSFVVGVLVQGNYGRRHQLRVDGVPVGRQIEDLLPLRGDEPRPDAPPREGSVLVVIATDAPLSDRQLGRLTRRGMLGIGRTGGIAGHTSGDLLLAFSNPPQVRVPRRNALESDRVPLILETPRLHDAWMDPLFEATIDATEEAVINAMVAATTLRGREGNTLFSIPHARLRELLASR